MQTCHLSLRTVSGRLKPRWTYLGTATETQMSEGERTRQCSFGSCQECWCSPFVLNVWKTAKSIKLKRQQSCLFLWGGGKIGRRHLSPQGSWQRRPDSLAVAETGCGVGGETPGKRAEWGGGGHKLVKVLLSGRPGLARTSLRRAAPSIPLGNHSTRFLVL